MRDQGLRMAETIVRRERLIAQQQAMGESAPFARVAGLMQNYDSTLVSGTLDSFEPAVPVTAEGVVFAAAGFGVVYGFLALLGLPYRRRRRRRAIEAAA